MNVRSKYELLIQTTISSIAHSGIENFNMKQLTRSANVATGTCYYHFKGKDDLLLAATDYIYLDLLKIVNNYYKAPDFKLGFKQLFLALCEYFLAKSDNYFALKALTNYKIVASHHSKKRPEFITALESFLQQGITNKQFNYLPLEFIASMFMANVNTVVAYKKKKELLPDAALDEKFSTMCWNQLKAS